ncbi:unnamed protein product [Cuscuta epithymum]|uniref:Remorin C-terminal domain-containing protein n=1 Tax=Cuscuta epithymum TaxID=186058 RepID=A0AAV0DE86_9ASTE|nr:unnamed protein product [Cuscuta epithymum]CAH9130232.1 unnamed protein product [Cuscuta epithymum]
MLTRIAFQFSAMDLQAPPPLFPSQMEFDGNPFLDSYPNPLCKLNIKETSDLVTSFPTANVNNGPENRRLLQISAGRTKRNVADGPSTPGRPIFSFSVGNFSRKSVPSKWDDAEKWVVNGGSHESPVAQHNPFLKFSTQQKCSSSGFCPKQAFPEICRVGDEKVAGPSKGVSSATSGVLLKDKCTSEVETIRSPDFRSMKEGFLFGNMSEQCTKEGLFPFGDGNCTSRIKFMKNNTTQPDTVLEAINHRDIGTEMTPMGSSTTSRCPTPFKSLSPVRYNTPASRSGPLALPNDSSSSSTTLDIVQLQEYHLAKLHVGNVQHASVTSNYWSSREEEEDDVSKSLRHFEMNTNNECGIGSKVDPWEEEMKTKNCLRYKRELAKIQAWVNLQSARSEAQSKKLEVKIQKMRSKMEEKLMKRMSTVHRKAEEWRAAAHVQHEEQMKKVSEETHQMVNMKNINNVYRINSSCTCISFPCNKHLI